MLGDANGKAILLLVLSLELTLVTVGKHVKPKVQFPIGLQACHLHVGLLGMLISFLTVTTHIYY
jgi:hypothetical protein